MRPPPIASLIAATTLIRLAFAATTGLGVDESYMVTAGRTLSLGYFDHPPASWWLSWAAAHLFNTEAPWAVRLPFILLFALSQFLTARITRHIASEKAAFWAVAALNVSPVFGVTTATWVLPDGPLDAALLGATLCLLNALPATGQRAASLWAATGICAGLALFAKYSAILTIAGAFLYLLASRRHRHWLARPEPYIAAALALTVFAPVLLWNATHHWASFAFQGDRAAGLRLRPFMPLQILGGEALFILPWIWLPMMILLIRGFRRAWPERLLAWLAAPPIVVFAAIAAWSSQRILFHWAAPGYLMLFPLLGAEIASRSDQPRIRHVIAGSAALVLTALIIIATQLQFEWLGGGLTSILRTDPTAEGLDWTSVRDDLRARGLLPPGTVAAAVNWRDAGKFGHALGPETMMLCLNTDARQFGFADPPTNFAGQDVLVLALDPAAKTAATPWFRSVEELAKTEVRLDGRALRTVTVLRGHGLLQ